MLHSSSTDFKWNLDQYLTGLKSQEGGILPSYNNNEQYLAV